MAERASNGTFVKGHKGGPGRPRRRTEEQYLNATIGRVSLADWKKIVDKAVEDAIVGDYKAREWLGDYLLGKAPSTVNLQGDGSAFDIGIRFIDYRDKFTPSEE